MHRTPGTGVVVAICLLLGATACSGSDNRSEADVTKQLSTVLQSTAGNLSKTAADCWAKILVDEVGVSAMKKLDLSASQPPPELAAKITAASARFATECTTSTTVTTSPTSTTTPSTTAG